MEVHCAEIVVANELRFRALIFPLVVHSTGYLEIETEYYVTRVTAEVYDPVQIRIPLKARVVVEVALWTAHIFEFRAIMLEAHLIGDFQKRQ